MKQAGMLLISLRGVNFGIWSLGVFRAKRQYFIPPRSRLGFRKETQNYAGLLGGERGLVVGRWTCIPEVPGSSPPPCH